MKSVSSVWLMFVYSFSVALVIDIAMALVWGLSSWLWIMVMQSQFWCNCIICMVSWGRLGGFLLDIAVGFQQRGGGGLDPGCLLLELVLLSMVFF